MLQVEAHQPMDPNRLQFSEIFEKFQNELVISNHGSIEQNNIAMALVLELRQSFLKTNRFISKIFSFAFI